MNVKPLIISLGSNLGNRFSHLQHARKHLDQIFGPATAISDVYETPPWGKTDQPHFYNQVVVYDIHPSIHVHELLKTVLEIESKLGRERFEKWGPRVIDIDILYLGQEIHANKFLKIPHPEIANRRFVLIPLNQILPDFNDPVWGKSIKELLFHCADQAEVVQIPES